MDSGLIVGLAMGGSGALLLAIGAFFFMRTRKFLATAQDASGTVVDLEVGSGSEGGTVYSPVIEFALPDGRTVRFTDGLATNPPAHDVGEQVQVKFDPTRPEKAKLATSFRLYFVSGLLGGMGALFLVIGVLVAILVKE
jgi:hypothetical protein